MACLLYYIPDKAKSIPPTEVCDAGLGYAFQGRLSAVEIRGGPDKKNGVLFTAAGDSLGEHILGYYPERQTWQNVPKSTAWVGCYDDDRPGPGDLLQPNPLGGHPVLLGDGNEWTVPVARAIVEEENELRYHCALPSGVTLNGNGQWCRGGPVKKYTKLWSTALKFWDAWTAAVAGTEAGAGGADFDFDGLNDAALLALQANYRVGKAEVVLLGLFDGEPATAILQALIDWPSVQDWSQKKNGAAQPSPNVAAVDGGTG